MGGKSSSDQSSQSQSRAEFGPWTNANPTLLGILSGIQSELPNYQANSTEKAALGQLAQNVQGIPNFAPQAIDLTNSYLGGDPTGLLKPALANYNNVLNPIATGNLDPTKTPGIQNLLDTIRSDVSNSINGQFAGAGRDLSGLNQQALARGIAQGEAQPLLNQYNQNVQNAVGAATGMFGAAGNTASAIGGNQAQGVNFAANIPGLAAVGPQAALNVAQQGRQLPLQNLGMLENLTVPIAGLGGIQYNSGSSYSHGTQTPGIMQTALGWGQALGGGQGLTGALGKGLGILGMFGQGGGGVTAGSYGGVPFPIFG